MVRELRISLGQHSDRGRKESNQDFHGAMIPQQPMLGLKGIAVALADGISSSPVSRQASESAIKSVLTDYYCTPEAWSVRSSAQRVIAAANSWLHAQTRRSPYAYDRDKGYVCTLALLVLKSATAHLFHVGDSRIYRLSGPSLEPLTEDHRVAVSPEQSYLARALGMGARVEVDYRSLELEAGDVFVLATDGVCEQIDGREVVRAIAEGPDLDAAARAIVRAAFERGSTDNLTVQIVRVEEVADGDAAEALGLAADLSPPPLPEPRTVFEGYRIVRPLHDSSRSHIYLAVDEADGQTVVVKVPSIDMRAEPANLRPFMMEEWIARRIDSPHVLKPRPHARKRNFLYVVLEFVEGQTLRQWMVDNPRPDLETARLIVEQIAQGLRAFHRLEMLHRDLRPENVMIDRTGTVKIIDFGAVRVAGVAEARPAEEGIPGTAQYTAPEYFLGERGSPGSDLYSLGVIAYEMLTGGLPYGAEMARARSRAQQRRIAYRPAAVRDRAIPAWVDGALRRAVHPDPARRYQELSELVFDLRHPNDAYLATAAAPLIERNPLLFWKTACFLLAGLVLLLLYRLLGR